MSEDGDRPDSPAGSGDSVESVGLTGAARRIRELEEELLLLGRHTVFLTRDARSEALDRSAYLLLSRLERDEPLTIKDLAEALGLDVSTINRQVGALLRQQLVERSAHPAEGGARPLRPTAEGLRRLTGDRDRHIRAMRVLLDDWDAADVETLVSSLRRLNQRIEERQGLSWPRGVPAHT